MKLFRNLAGAALAVLAAATLAGPAFEISGLHVGLVFTDAIVRAEQLGGVCQSGNSRRRGGGVIAQCDYPQCAEGGLSDRCNEQNPTFSALAIASQPITRIVLEAPAVSSGLKRIAISFEGSTEAVTERLKQEFGQPIKDTSATTAGSWSHSRRLHWKQGSHNMGLIESANKIMLTADPVRHELGSVKN